VLRSWSGIEDARIAVVTDGRVFFTPLLPLCSLSQGSRILGLGDLGANGLPISIGKL